MVARMIEPWLTKDYRGWWVLPEPLPPARWPRWLMAVIAGEIVLAICGAEIRLK
jgi:hypothetical protein